MNILFSAYHNIYITKDFVFFKGKYYYIKNNYIINEKTIKIDKKINNFLSAFSSKLLNGYYTLDFKCKYNPITYIVSPYLTTLKSNPSRPLVHCGKLFVHNNLTLSEMVYEPLSNYDYTILDYIVKYMTKTNCGISDDEINRIISYLKI